MKSDAVAVRAPTTEGAELIEGRTRSRLVLAASPLCDALWTWRNTVFACLLFFRRFTGAGTRHNVSG